MKEFILTAKYIYADAPRLVVSAQISGPEKQAVTKLAIDNGLGSVVALHPDLIQRLDLPMIRVLRQRLGVNKPIDLPTIEYVANKMVVKGEKPFSKFPLRVIPLDWATHLRAFGIEGVIGGALTRGFDQTIQIYSDQSERLILTGNKMRQELYKRYLKM